MSSNKATPEIAARFDRHARLLNRLGSSEADGVRKFLGQRVLLTGDARMLSTRPGRLMLATAANLISRFCPKIDILLPAAFESLGEEVLQRLRAIDGAPHAVFRILDARPQQEVYAAVVSVGPTLEAYGPTVTIESSGWLAAVSKSGILANGVSDPENPFGALMAASLGAAEVFKYLLEPLNVNAFHFGDVTFSVYDYRIGSTRSRTADPHRAFTPALPSGRRRGGGQCYLPDAIASARASRSHVPGGQAIRRLDKPKPLRTGS